MNNTASLILTVLLLVPLTAYAIEVGEVRCEYRENPLGVDAVKPRLSWIIQDRGQNAGVRNQTQTAYQVLVASASELLAKDKGDLWDSGKVVSDEQNQVEYAGKPLASRAVCHWKVRIWDGDGNLSAWSQPAFWSMGLLKPEDWRAQWIGCHQPPPLAHQQASQQVLVIRKAVYQTADGTISKDVTASVAGLVRDNTLQMRVSNKVLGGDLAPGRVKHLVVDYEIHGHAGTQQRRETEELILPPPDPFLEEQAWPRPRYLRKEFAVGRPVRRATVYVTALGLYELRLNGQRVGDHLLAPEWTDYRKRVQYQTFNVTGLVRSGSNALGAILGNGWYSGGWQHWKKQLKAIYGTEPYLFAQLEIEFDDARCERVVTDGSWRGTIDGPLQFAGIYEGASYDARKEMPGWDAPGFDDSKWLTATVRSPGADFQVGKLVWPRGNPIRATREIKPVALTEPKPGVYVFAFDQNMVGHCRFAFRGKAGQTVELQHGEMRNPDGTVFTGNLCVVSVHRAQLDRYTFRTDGVETCEPRFTYHGFQYVEVRGLTEKPSLESLTGVVFHSDCPVVGSFTCSEPMLNRLAQNILWSQRANYMGVPTDCPQRNERCGYTGDAEFFMRAAVYNMDVAAFFSRWLVDVCQDAQMPAGHFADHAPTYGPGDNQNIGWADAGIICPYEIYRTYGDTRVIREHYVAMKRYLDALTRQSRDFLFTGRVGNGDWLNTGGGASKEVIGTAFMAFDFRLMAEMADAIGQKSDAAAFRDQFEKITAAFAKTYLDAEGRIAKSSQTGYALAFTMDLVPSALREKMIERFGDEIRKFDWHPRTGFIGTPRLLPGLHLAGLDADAYKLLLTKKSPSWLYPVGVGATTIWEQWVAWDGKTPRGGMNSLNHYSFGAVGEYLFGMIGGIQPAAPGYKKIKIAPVICDGLSWANTSYDSIRGRIVSNWKYDGDRLTMEVVIPANTTAEVFVLAKDVGAVTESGKPITQVEGVKFLRTENNAAVYAIGSGTYHFQSTLPESVK